jgi:hypothetical protein
VKLGEYVSRIFLCSWFGALGVTLAVQAIQEGAWWGYLLFAVGVLATYGLVRQLRGWAHRSPDVPEDRWTRTDGGVTAIVVLSAASRPVSAWLSDDLAAERLSHLVVAPIWIALAVSFVILRKRFLRRIAVSSSTPVATPAPTSPADN